MSIIASEPIDNVLIAFSHSRSKRTIARLLSSQEHLFFRRKSFTQCAVKSWTNIFPVNVSKFSKDFKKYKPLLISYMAILVEFQPKSITTVWLLLLCSYESISKAFKTEAESVIVLFTLQPPICAESIRRCFILLSASNAGGTETTQSLTGVPTCCFIWL